MVHAQVDTAGLRPAVHAESIRTYLREVWQRQQYIRYVAASDLRAQRVNTVLGNVWHLLNPALQIGTTYLIFGVLVDISRGVDNFVAFLTVGIFVFTFTQRSTMGGSKAIISNMPLVKTFAFPRAMLPITNIVSGTMAYIPAVAMMLIATVATGDPVRLSWLALLGIIPLHVAFNLGAAFIAARATFLLRDVREILPFIFRLLYYFSGVIFLVEAWIHGSYRWLFIGNPLYCWLTMYRWAVLGLEVETAAVISAITWTVVILVGGFWWFKAGEGTYGRG